MSIVSLHFRTFVHESEDEQKVIEAMRFATGLEEFERESSEGHHGNKIVILEGHIKDKKAVKAFFKRMPKDDVQTMLDTLEMRVDEDCFIFFRLDKQKAYLGELSMTTTDDAIAVRGKVQSYPRKLEVALKGAKEYLESFLGE
ncbi:MAG: hypothetical protein A4E32_01603 [Methanomassiliicoccales archaeon PtaU1.Bin124]|nr:MAG: hypothetical protein A4E32_01603 [Methanomassiliicoccales archaeon PtaU1.Bin124]